MGERQHAAERMIVTGPDGIDRIVAKGDPIPDELAGYIENNPNRVDAAANYDDVDAADKAAQAPNERVVERFGSVDSAGLSEIRERVAAGKDDSSAADGDPVDATDSARELAAEAGIDLTTVSGSGTNGRVTKDDVKSAIAARED